MTAADDKSTSVQLDPDATVAATGVAAIPKSQFVGHVFGDYKLLDEIARGGMGIVFKAQQQSLNRTVAVKMTLAGQFARPEDVKRFKAEAEAAAGLDHSNILPVYEVGSVQGQPFFAMKLVSGGSLSTELKKRYPECESPGSKTLQKKIAVLKSVFASDSVAPLVQLLVPVARAVHFAHQRGILHRDLKPGNILIDVDGTPYVTDFGLAKRVEGDASLTQTGAVVGTPSYMAPEQARAEKQLSTAVDVYSLGAILYEALTGRPPFRAATVMETIMQVLEHDPEPPSKIAPGADKDLSVIAMKCLEKEPSRRYASAAEFATELERWLKGESIQARQVGNVRKTWRWAKRRPLIAGLITALLVSMIGGTAMITRLYFKSASRLQLAMDELNRLTAERDAARRQQIRADESQRRIASLQYASDIALAAKLLETGDTPRAKLLLHQLRPEQGQLDLRGFEWHYLSQISRNARPESFRNITIRNSEQPSIANGPFFFTSDNQHIVASRSAPTTAEPKVQLLHIDITTSAPKKSSLIADTQYCWAVSDGPERLAILRPTSNSGPWKIWNTTTTSSVDIPEPIDGPTSESESWILSPNGQFIAGQTDSMQPSNIVLREIASKREVVLFTNRKLSQFCLFEFSQKGETLIAIDNQGNIQQFDVATGKAGPPKKIGIDLVGKAAFDPENRLAYFIGFDGFLYQFDITTDRLVAVFSGLSIKNRAIFVSPDHRRLFVWFANPDDTDAITMWTLDSGRELLKLPLPKGRVHAVDLSPDGTKLAAHLDDAIVIWDATPSLD